MRLSFAVGFSQQIMSTKVVIGFPHRDLFEKPLKYISWVKTQSRSLFKFLQ